MGGAPHNPRAAAGGRRRLVLGILAGLALRTGMARAGEAAVPLGPPAREPQSGYAGGAGGVEGLGAGRVVLALAGTVGMLVAIGLVVRVVARRHGGLRAALGAGGRAPSGVVEVLGRFPVARGCSLVLLKLDRRVLLLNQSSARRLGGTHLTTLCEITQPEDVASILMRVRDDEGNSMARRFEGLLRGEEREAERALRPAPTSAAKPPPAGAVRIPKARTPDAAGLSQKLAAMRQRRVEAVG